MRKTHDQSSGAPGASPSPQPPGQTHICPASNFFLIHYSILTLKGTYAAFYKT